MASRELPTDRLSTSEKSGKRIYLYPKEVEGFWKRLRSKVHFILIFVFLCLPWIKINGHQAILFDVLRKRFSIFGITFWAHDAPMLVFVFGGAALTLGLITALWGRVWCGWACPQTVFIESVFRFFEMKIEGDHLERKRLDESPLTLKKFSKKTFKWALFILFALIISHSFLAYFIDTTTLSQMIRSSPRENRIAFSIMFIFTSAILFDFGWFREQFCVVVCPYGRFQSVLMDAHSLYISYDEKRGEPRRGTEVQGQAQGACVNCYKCVQVCPTGIDIRRGQQLECIACTACIDACDEVMDRTHQPRGLIKYSSAVEVSGSSKKFVRGRTLAYFSIITLIAGALLWNISHRQDVEVSIVRSTEMPFQEIQDPKQGAVIVNHFRGHFSNQSFHDLRVHFRAEVKTTDANQPVISDIISAQSEPLISAGAKLRYEFFIKFPKSVLSFGKSRATIFVLDDANKTLDVEEVPLVGPYQ